MHTLAGSAGAQANVLQTKDGHSGGTDKLCLTCKFWHACIGSVHDCRLMHIATKNLLWSAGIKRALLHSSYSLKEG